MLVKLINLGFGRSLGRSDVRFGGDGLQTTERAVEVTVISLDEFY